MRSLTGLLLANHTSRGRLAAVGAVGGILVLLAVAILVGDGGEAAARDLVTNAGLGLLVPVAAVVFGTSVLGDPADDGTIGYFLTTPQPRWRIAVPGVVAAAIAVVPLAVIPLVAALAINALSAATILAAAVAATLAILAYTGVFVALGVRFRRALLVGLLYVAIWEGILAGFNSTLQRMSIRHYALALQEALRGQPVPEGAVSGVTAAVVLIGLTIAGTALAALVLRSHVARS